MFYGISKGLIYDSDFMVNLRKEGSTGLRYKYAEGTLDNAYFHLPEELSKEICEAGFNFMVLHGVRGD